MENCWERLKNLIQKAAEKGRKISKTPPASEGNKNKMS